MRYLIALFITLAPSLALAIDCKPLEPSEERVLSREIQGEFDAKVTGIISRLGGASAEIDGIYKETLSELSAESFEDRDKIFIWSKLIYLKCELLRDSDFSDEEKSREFSSLSEMLLSGPPAPSLEAEPIIKYACANISSPEVHIRLDSFIKDGQLVKASREERTAIEKVFAGFAAQGMKRYQKAFSKFPTLYISNDFIPLLRNRDGDWSMGGFMSNMINSEETFNLGDHGFASNGYFKEFATFTEPETVNLPKEIPAEMVIQSATYLDTNLQIVVEGKHTVSRRDENTSFTYWSKFAVYDCTFY